MRSAVSEGGPILKGLFLGGPGMSLVCAVVWAIGHCGCRLRLEMIAPSDLKRRMSCTLEPYLLRPFKSAILLRGNIPPFRIGSANGQTLDQNVILACPLHQSVPSNGPFSVAVTRECFQCDLRLSEGNPI
ncbi:hypothetical protein CEXT_320201 [Caerostris extrusa]|uniref:Uncharacterized protein n=1 Tax=Caerostris extrusa TaxID=172846 RepID=A0AAV4WYS4_CAEEX|nr:hypothetical protein CEXT_320201 [Caerostris extrusa]